MTPLTATLKAIVLGDRRGVAARLFGSARRHRYAAIALGAWSNAFTLVRRGAETFGILDRRHGAPVFNVMAVAAGLWLPRWRWADCCGLAAAFALPAGAGAHGLVQGGCSCCC